MIPDTGLPSTTYDDIGFYSGYESTTCTGTLFLAFVVPIQPRMVFSLSDGRGFRVRGDQTPTQTVTLRSRIVSGTCTGIASPTPARGFEVSEPFSLTKTVPVFRPPLHLERR